MANEALALHIEGMMEDGDLVPMPSSLNEIMADPIIPVQSSSRLRYQLISDK